MAPIKNETGSYDRITTVEDLIAELSEHFLSDKVKIWIRGDGVSVPIEAIERSIVEDGMVYLEIELGRPK